jgi:hypothetical protein
VLGKEEQLPMLWREMGFTERQNSYTVLNPDPKITATTSIAQITVKWLKEQLILNRPSG